uniref:STIL centriolar assembly protein n=1 Tax=Mastacembelus armatus TaxID=205130 RepID=A0A7N8X5U7_9TELE
RPGAQTDPQFMRRSISEWQMLDMSVISEIGDACLCRKPRLVLLEKALRLAQRHVRHSNKLHLHCFFLGSVSVDSDEEGVTVTLDRFDPGRDQAGSSSRVPSALLPGDILVPCLFSTQTEAMSDAVVQSEAELHHCFKVLQQFVSSRQTLDLSQLLKVRARVVCSQQADAAVFGLSWSAVCPSVCVELEPVRAVPVIPTALLRSLTSTSRAFLTMDQTRKLLLLLESDPKASNLPLVGLWLSGITHIYNPQVWAWCLRFLFSSALQDRVLSESGCFLLVLFGATHRAPQFFQCRAPGPQLDCQLLTAFQSVTLFSCFCYRPSLFFALLQCDSRLSSVLRAPPPAAGLSVSDQDSGVEDEDFSPRPSPSPHAPAQQVSHRQKGPCVVQCAAELRTSSLILSLLSICTKTSRSFTSNQHGWKDPGSAHRPPSAADRKFGPPAGNSSTSNSSDPRSAPPQLHSTPNSNLQQPCTCCSPHTYDCTSVFSSPRLHPAAHHSSHHHAPPSRNPPSSPSVPPSSPHGAHTSSHHPAPSASTHRPIPPSFKHPTPSLPHNSCSPLSSHQPTPLPSSFLLPPPSCPCSHPAPVPCCGDSPSANPSRLSDPLPAPWPRPSCMNHCCEQVGGAVPADTYQLLLHQDQQLRLLQAQVTAPHVHVSCRSSETKLELVSEQRWQTETGAQTAPVWWFSSCGSKGADVLTLCSAVLSTLASINPAAAVSRLSVSDPTVSSLFPGGSVDLSLEANAIALRYLSDSQLSRLSLGGHALQPGPASSSMSVLSPSNMSLATRKYMRRYGLIEEEDEEDLEEVGVQEASSRQPLREALNGKLLPQSQLLRDLRPKMQLLATDSKGNAPDKENCSSMRPSLVRAISRQTEGSVGNILDLSRLRQLPKLF